VNGFHKVSQWFNLILEARCPLCQRSTPGTFCLDCQRQLNQCRRLNPAQRWQDELPLFAWGQYQSTLKRALAALKYENKPQIAAPLGLWLGQAWQQSQCRSRLLRNPSLVVPIPLHAQRQQQRGYNQADLLARSFCAVTGLQLQSQGLLRVQATQPQFSLTLLERQANVAQAFSLGPGLKSRVANRSLLILDDIYTTGVTAKAAADVLRQAGFSVIGIVAVASAELD
jgi:ComF family protein